MKTKVILLIAISAIATLSFTLVSVNTKQATATSEVNASQEPAGGLLSEEKL